MTEKRKLNVNDAYSIKTPEDSVRLYGEWAETYDTGFVDSTGYVAHLRIAEIMFGLRSQIRGAVLDVGCGTGVVGASLRECGFEVVDGIDISEAMLAEAGKKQTSAGDPVYHNLLTADLTQKLDIPDRQYAGLVSAGTFTHGHLGPDSLDELWRVAAPSAHCAICVRSTHFEAAGFGEKLSADVARGMITQPGLVEVKLYSSQSENPQHAGDTALIVVCQVV